MDDGIIAESTHQKRDEIVVLQTTVTKCCEPEIFNIRMSISKIHKSVK